MSTAPTVRPGDRGLRLWPGVVAVSLQWLLWLVVPIVAPEWEMVGFIGGMAAVLVVLAWWLFFSRAPWVDRIGAIVIFAVGVILTKLVVHPSVANGMMGLMVFLYPIPGLCLALVAWAAITRRMPAAARRALMLVAVVIGCGFWTLVRTDGLKGGGAQLQWRWTPTAEERLLAQERNVLPAPAPSPAIPASAVTSPGTPATPPRSAEPAAAPASDAKPAAPIVEVKSAPGTDAVPAALPMTVLWAGFRGGARDGVVPGARIATDWAAQPPVLLWRRAVGPGWSSFAVGDDMLYTQEQRGDDEVVAAYRVATGEPVWGHRDRVRFWESNGGAGPRATPTLNGGRVYSVGATGIINALDARTGAVVWSRNAVADAGTTVPGWGIASSPLVVGDLVIAGPAGRLVAYDARTGKVRWLGPMHHGSYSSPERMTIGGVEQIVMLSGAGATSVAPADGRVLWEHRWEGTTIVQPAPTRDGDVLISTASATGGLGVRRLAVAQGESGWTVTERWTSRGLKPYFNDYVVHKGFAYGFDGNILSCIALADGERKWKGGRFGNGQLVLLPGQDLLLVISEDGELALVGATPDGFSEPSRFQALEGKTWNHPVLVGDLLLVRNGEQMAAFRLGRRD